MNERGVKEEKEEDTKNYDGNLCCPAKEAAVLGHHLLSSNRPASTISSTRGTLLELSFRTWPNWSEPHLLFGVSEA